MVDPISTAIGISAATLTSTLTGVSAAATVAGGALTAEGALASGASQQAMYNYQAGVAQLNSKIAAQNADYAQTAGGTVGLQSGFRTADVVGRERAAAGASGLDPSSGSPLAVQGSTTKLGQYDQDLIATNYAKKAYGYEVEAATQTASAGADIIAGDESVKAGDIKAAGSILGTVGSVASKWTQASTIGIGSSGRNTSAPVYAPDDI